MPPPEWVSKSLTRESADFPLSEGWTKAPLDRRPTSSFSLSRPSPTLPLRSGPSPFGSLIDRWAGARERATLLHSLSNPVPTPGRFPRQPWPPPKRPDLGSAPVSSAIHLREPLQPEKKAAGACTRHGWPLTMVRVKVRVSGRGWGLASGRRRMCGDPERQEAKVRSRI